MTLSSFATWQTKFQERFPSLFARRQNGALKEVSGVDIASNGIKVVTALKTEEGVKVVRSLFSPLPAFHDDPKRNEKTAQLLAQLLEDEQIDPENVVLTLHPEEVSYRILTVPFVNRRKINAVLPFELEKYIPFHLEDVCFASMVLKEKEGETSLLVASCKKVVLEEELQILQEAGINPIGISTDAAGIATSLLMLEEEKESASALLYVGIDHSTICIQQGGMLKSINSCDVGGRSLKTKEGSEDLLRFIQLALFAYQREPDSSSLKTISLAGEGHTEPILLDALKLLRDVEIKEWSFFSPHFSVEGFQPGLVDLSLFPAALGLSVGLLKQQEPLNFRTGQFAFRSEKREYAALMKQLGVMASLLLLLLGVNVEYQKLSLHSEVQGVKKEIRSQFHLLSPDSTRIVNALAQLETKLKEAEAERKSLALYAGVKGQFLDGFADMSQAIFNVSKNAMELISLRYDNETIRLEGETSSFERADRIKNALEAVPSFKKVAIEDMRLDKQRNRVRLQGLISFSEGTEGVQ